MKFSVKIVRICYQALRLKNVHFSIRGTNFLDDRSVNLTHTDNPGEFSCETNLFAEDELVKLYANGVFICQVYNNETIMVKVDYELDIRNKKRMVLRFVKLLPS